MTYTYRAFHDFIVWVLSKVLLPGDNSPPAQFAPAQYTCENLVVQGNAASLFPNCTVT